MAATEVLTKVAYQIRLNNGIDADGNTKTVAVSLGKISLSRYNVDSAFALSQLFGAISEKPIHRYESTKTSTVMNA